MTENNQDNGKHLITRAAYARLKKWNRSYLSKKFVKEKMAAAIEQCPNTGRELVNVEKADIIFKNDINPAKVRKSANADQDESASEGYASTRTAREKIKLENEQIALLKIKGETLSKKAVMDACALAGQKLQEHLKAGSRRMSEKFATISDARQIKALMDEEFRKMLEHISDELMQKFTKGNT
jgi:hypothetical protein